MKQAKIFIAFTFLLAFAVCVSAQRVQFPNELEGYEFYGKGKLKDLKPGVSTIEDVKRVFAKHCIFDCDYNRNWTISFNYFSNVTRIKNVNEKKIEYVSDRSFSETLYSITLQPKSNISFQAALLLPIFKFRGKGSYSYNKNKVEETLSFDVYSDEYGLEYSVFDKTLSTKDTNLSKLKNGYLLFITYKITDELREKILIKQK
jgi:hypothetical protein